MCTAITYSTRDFYFGRNFDLEYSYREEVVVVPRAFPLRFRLAGSQNRHYAMIGMAYVQDGYPLFYDAVNEKGLAAAGLNFPGNAVYFPPREGKENVSPFELIPYLLSRCADLKQARAALERINLSDIPFSEALPLTPLHWMVSDASGSIVVEQTADGLHVYENGTGVLTNSPPFPVMECMLSNYMALSIEPPVNRLAKELPLRPYSRGMGAMGLPGDLSSASRFVKAVFTRCNAVSGESEQESVNQFFHILGAVEQQRGCVKLGDAYEVTLYSSCCNATKGIYYYKTYEDSRIRGVDMHREDLDGTALCRYEPIVAEAFELQN